jgi:hypothetical protein
MAAKTIDVAGHGPLSFTDSNGNQVFVPLSALEFVGSDIQLKTDWAAQFSATDQQILVALAGARATGGELLPPPIVPAAPAVALTASVPGPESSGISVHVEPESGTTVVDAKVKLKATETDVYAGLTDAASAKQTIGVDTAPTKPEDPPEGTGLVRVQAAGTTTDGLPKDGQSLTVKAAGTKVVAADGTKTLFMLVPRPGAPSGGIPVTVAVDTTAGTFTVTATHDTGDQPAVDLTSLDALPAAVTFLVTASAPPGGLAVPAEQDVQLTGGAPGIAATGVAYTS